MLTLPFIALVLLTFVTVVAVPCNLAVLPLLRGVGQVRPAQRSLLLLGLLAAPWLLGGGVLISSVVDILFGACADGQTCLWNEDPHLVEHARALIAAPLLAGLCVAGWHLARQLVAGRRAVRAMLAAATHDAAADAWIVPGDSALAFAAAGRVFLSAALRDRLEPAQVQAVLLHERAHIQRSDGICQLIARILSCMLVPPLRRRVLAALTLANEQACDLAAAAGPGRLAVASAILAAERLSGATSCVLSPAFAQSDVAARVHRLLAAEPTPWSAARVYALVICGALSVFLFGDLLYYAGMFLLYPGSVS